jgi:tetratricopeptide (TPR) repeat protein
MNSFELMRAALDKAREQALKGDPAAAVFHAQTACALASDVGELPLHAEAQTVLTQQLFYLGRFEEALRHGARARDDWRRLAEPGRECEVLVLMALAFSEEEVHDRALLLARTAHGLVQTHGLHDRQARVLALLGGLHGRLASWDEGEALLMQALSLARDHHDSATVVVALNALLMLLGHACEAHRAAARSAQAEATARRLLGHARQALAQSASEPLPFRRVVLRCNVANALIHGGQAAEALGLLQGTVEEADANGFRVAGLRARSRLVRALLALGDQAGAAEQAAGLAARLDREDHVQAREELLGLQAELAQNAAEPLRALALRQQADQLAAERSRREATLRQALEAHDAFMAQLTATTAS